MPAATEPTPTPLRIPLTQLKRGDRAIVEMEALANDESRLLAAMGLADGAEVRICRAGTPCIVQTLRHAGSQAGSLSVGATRLGISADMAARIMATPCDCGPDQCKARCDT